MIFFFTPDSYGDMVQFYRLTKQPVSLVRSKEERLISHSMCTLRDDSYFEFDESEENIRIRKEIDQTFGHSLVHKIPAIQSVESIRFIGFCYDYAFGAIFKTYSPPSFMPILPDNDWIEGYFTVTIEPKEGDLVCYYDTLFTHPVHYGVYVFPNLVESKWGQGFVYKHPPFCVGGLYGNYIKYYHLKSV